MKINGEFFVLFFCDGEQCHHLWLTCISVIMYLVGNSWKGYHVYIHEKNWANKIPPNSFHLTKMKRIESVFAHVELW